MDTAHALARGGRWAVKRIAEVLEVARSNLMERLKERTPASPPTATESLQDTHLLRRIQTLVKTRPTYGYRRVTALLNQGVPAEERINHKRVYRVMRDHGLLLSKYAEKPQRTHEGKVMTLKSNLRWCSDIFEIRCWNGDRVFVSFSLDCCDREVLSFVAQPQHLLSEDIQDLMAMSLEQRFGRDCMRLPHAIEWLSDNGPQYISKKTQTFAQDSGFKVCTTPSYSPESNGMAEAFVKTFKRDYVYVNDIWNAESVLEALPSWFEDYNNFAPHKGLKMMSPRAFRRASND